MERQKEILAKHTPSYVLSDLTLCMTMEEWKEWFETTTERRYYPHVTDFETWFLTMTKEDLLFPCNTLAYFKAPAANGCETNVLISVHKAGTEIYYELSADGGSVAGDWEDINDSFHEQTNMKLEAFLLHLLKMKNTEYSISPESIWFVYGNTEVNIKIKHTEEIVKWINAISKL